MSLSFTGRCCACLTFLCFAAVGTAQPVEPAVAKAKNNHDSAQFTTVDPAGYLPDWLTKKTALGDIEWTIDKFRSWLEQQYFSTFVELSSYSSCSSLVFLMLLTQRPASEPGVCFRQ